MQLASIMIVHNVKNKVMYRSNKVIRHDYYNKVKTFYPTFMKVLWEENLLIKTKNRTLNVHTEHN